MQASPTSWLDLEWALATVGRRLKWVGLQAAALAWLAGAAAFLLVFVIADHTLRTGVPETIRTPLCLLFWLGTLAWWALAGAWPLMRQLNALYLARLIEKNHPQFRNCLIDAILIPRETTLPGSVRAAVLDQAARQLSGVTLQSCVSTRPRRRAAGAAAGTAALFVLYAAWAPKPVTPSLWRGVGLPLPPPTRTRIVALSPDDHASVLSGQPVSFAALLAGHLPDAAFVRFSPDDGITWPAGQQIPLAPPDPRTPRSQWQADMPGQEIQRSLTWQVVAGDAVSEIRRLDVRPAPAITDVWVRYEYPPETGLPPATQPGGNLDALRGTRATIHASTNVPAFHPVLVLKQGAQEQRRVPDSHPDGTSELVVSLLVAADGQYRIEFSDAGNEPNRNSPTYTIRARPTPPHAPGTAPAPLELARQPASTPAPDEPASAPESEPAPIEQVARLDAPASAAGPLAEGVSQERPGSASAPASAPDDQAPPASAPAPQAEAQAAAPQSAPADQTADAPPGAPNQESEVEASSRPARTQAEFARRHERQLEVLARHLLDMPQAAGQEPPDAGGPLPDRAARQPTPGEPRQGGPPGGSPGQDQAEAAPAPGATSQVAQGTGLPVARSQQPGPTGQAHTPGAARSARPPSNAPGQADAQPQEAPPPNPSDPPDAATTAGQDGPGAATGSSESAAGHSPAEAAPGQSQARAGRPPRGSGSGAAGGLGQEPSPSPRPGAGRGSGPGEGDRPGRQAGPSPSVPTVGQTRQVVDALDRSLRRGELNPELLTEMDWDLAEARQFVEEFRGLKAPPHAAPPPAPPAPSAGPMAPPPTAPPQVQWATGPAADGVAVLHATDSRPADDTRDLLEVGRQRVPQAFEPLLKAYYRTLASRPAP